MPTLDSPNGAAFALWAQFGSFRPYKAQNGPIGPLFGSISCLGGLKNPLLGLFFHYRLYIPNGGPRPTKDPPSRARTSIFRLKFP